MGHNMHFLPVVFLLLSGVLVSAKSVSLQRTCDSGSENTETLVDCYPENGSTEEGCTARGCIWTERPPNTSPWCTFPPGYGYYVVQQTETALGYDVDLRRKPGQVSLYGNEVDNLRLSLEYINENVLRLKFFDPNNKRYEVPLPLDTVPGESKPATTNYYVKITNETQFGVNVIRTETGISVFNTAIEGFIFSDQFLQIITLLPSSNVYGFGEHRHGRYQHDLNWKTWSMFGRDMPPVNDGNLYGIQPFYMNVENDGNANGVFLLNSNAMEVTLQPSPALTYRAIGGILDFYVYLGPTPEDVAQQHHRLVGLPQMPSYWFLGFNLCRYGYTGTDHIRTVINRMLDAKIPYDVQVTDIDTMDGWKDFSIDSTNFADLVQLVKEIHSNGQKYIPILDPAIGSSPDLIGHYKPLDDGLAAGIFVKFEDGTILEGKVWPGLTYFPDFSSNTTQEYWTNQFKYYHDELQIEFDGAWIDMNEPSNFLVGSVDGCERNQYNYPPYTTHMWGSTDGKITENTICMDTVQEIGRHYDVHNLYAHFEALRTFNALREVLPNKRPNILSRSQYAGSGKYTNHWLGDNNSEWDSMKDSIPGILEYNIFGIPVVGADICGFGGETTLELCIRWTQLGAFYPYSRNHNTIGSKDQDPPALGSEMVKAAITALTERYRLLPYLYTLVHKAHTSGGTVARALFHEFPKDSRAWNNEYQFLWGPALYISPVLEEGQTCVDVYFPNAHWFSYYTGKKVENTGGDLVTIDAPLDGVIPLHVRGGYIIPFQEPNVTTSLSRQNPFGLIVALDFDGTARGDLFWDDGETFGTVEAGEYNFIQFNLTKNEGNSTLNIFVEYNGFDDMSTPLDTIKFYGVCHNPSGVYVDGQLLDNSKVSYCAEFKVFLLQHLELELPASHTISFD